MASEHVIPARRAKIGRAVLVLMIGAPLVVDMATGALGKNVPIPVIGLSPSEIVRGGLFIGAAYVAVTRLGSIYTKVKLFVLTLGLAGLVAPMAVGLLGGSSREFMFDLEYLLKVLHGPLLILLVLEIVRRWELAYSDVYRALAVVGGIIGFLQLVAMTAGIGEATYAEARKGFFGFGGLYTGKNDMSVVLIVTMVSSVYLATRDKNVVGFGVLMLNAAALYLIGTRAATLSVLIVLPALLWYLWFRQAVSLEGVLAGVVLLMVGAGATYLLGLRTIERVQSVEWQESRYESLAEGDMPRALKVAVGLETIAQRGLAENAFGEGALAFQTDIARRLGSVEDRKLAEVDWVDLAGAHGWIFAVLLYSGWLYLLARVVIGGGVGSGASRASCVVSLSLVLFHASVAGHALTSAVVGGAVAPILGIAYAGLALGGVHTDSVAIWPSAARSAPGARIAGDVA